MAAGASPLRRRVSEERRSIYRQAISEAAERVFAEKGADASKMNEIATEAGVSLGTLYGVIEGKDSLVAEIHARRMREFLDCIRNASDSEQTTLTSHLAVVREGAKYFLDRPDFLRMCCRAGFGWASDFTTSPDGAALWEEGSAVPRRLFERGVTEGIYVDEDPELLTRKMLALKQVELAHWVGYGMETPHEEIVARLERQFIRAFCVPAERPGPGAGS